MSVFNVHANWFPVNGTVKHVSHQNGRFRAAYLPKSSTENERSAVVITTRNGVDVLARQIAGALARRIVTYAKVGLYLVLFACRCLPACRDGSPGRNGSEGYR